jgi:hypothetical protein
VFFIIPIIHQRKVLKQSGNPVSAPLKAQLMKTAMAEARHTTNLSSPITKEKIS